MSTSPTPFDILAATSSTAGGRRSRRARDIDLDVARRHRTSSRSRAPGGMIRPVRMY